MLQTLKKLFRRKPPVNFAELTGGGAQIIDVRTEGEYRTGHIKGSINIPLNVLQSRLGKIKKDKPVITCCASGRRSGMAKNILKSKGFTEVYNGGGWMSLQRRLQ